MLPPVDHLVYATTDLSTGVNEIERLVGVRATPGGKHTGRGSHNALLSLGRAMYLEIIAPDPDQPDPEHPRPFGLDTLREPRIVGWAMRTTDIERAVAEARSAGYDPGHIISMTRAKPDGMELRWQLTSHPHLPGDGLVPFLIHWEPGDHPSRTSPGGCALVDLEAEHPHSETVQPMIDALGIDLQVTEGGRPALIATIECPRGTVVIS